MEKVFGKHSVRAVFLTRPKSVKRILLLHSQKDNLEEFAQSAAKVNIAPEYLPWPKFLKEGELTQEDKHQGVCIITQERTIYTEEDIDNLKDASKVILLDTVSNPQNLGLILRAAAFFNIDAVMVIKNRSAKLTPTVLRITVGGAEFVKIFEITNLSRSIKRLKKIGFWIYGLDERGEKTLRETDFDKKTALIVGAEGEGLRHLTVENCDFLVRIEGGRKGLESLNAAVAASIGLYEIS
jgi:23S rRNA (guanosine2251-2'-O)-methyltransferase